VSTPLTAGQLLTSDRSFSHPCRGEISPVAVGPRLSVTQKEPDAMGERRGEGRFTNYGRVGSPDLPTSGALFLEPARRRSSHRSFRQLPPVKQAYRTYDECQQARAEVIETMNADHRTGLSRCDQLTIERRRPVRPCLKEGR